MEPRSALLDVLDKGIAWIEWALWLGAGVGAIMALVGFVRGALGNQASDTYQVQRGRTTLVKGVILSIAAVIASGLVALMANSSGDEKPARSEPAAADSVTGHLLVWGGIGLGALALAALGAWGVWRLRGRRAAKRRRWQALKAAHDSVASAYGDYLTDVLAWLERPALNDVAVPQTAALVEALAVADDARHSENVDRYQKSTAALATAWKAADDHARRTGLRYLEPAERDSVERARKLLATALDGAGSEHERRSAYAKARDLLDGILVVPPKAIEVLESKHRLALAPKAP
jgi:hypothetical protein